MKKLVMLLVLIPSFSSAATLADRLMSGDTSTRSAAQSEAQALSSDDLKSVISTLVHHLKSDDIDSREHAAEALGLLGPAASPAMEPLRKALNDDLPFVRIHSAEAIANMGTVSIPVLTDALKNHNGEIRSFAADTLGNFGEKAKGAIPNLIGAMQDKELAVRGAAIIALGKMGPSAAAAIPALRAAASDSGSGVSDKAAEVLTKIEAVTIGQKPIPKKVEAPIAEVPVVVATTPMGKKVPPKKKPVAVVHPKVRAAAKKAKVPPPPPPPTIDELLVLAQSTDTATSTSAQLAVIQRSTEAVPVLMVSLQGPSTGLSEISATLLEKIGTDEAKKAAEVYRKRVSDKKTASLLKDLRAEGKTSEDAMIGLAKIGDPIVKPVAQLLSDPRVSNRRAAATLLNRLGKISQPATSMLIDATDDKDADVRHQAAEALGKIGTPEAQKALRFFTIKDKFYGLISTFRH